MKKLFCVKTSSLRDAWLGSSPRMSIWTSYYWFQKKKIWQTFFTFTESMSLKFWSRPSVFILFYIIFVNFVILTFILTFKHSTAVEHILWMWEINNDPERSIEKVSETLKVPTLNHKIPGTCPNKILGLARGPYVVTSLPVTIEPQ